MSIGFDTLEISRDGVSIPPQDLDNEAALIASVITDDEYLTEAVAMVPDEGVFYREYHQKLWRIILDLHTSGSIVDGVTVWTEAKIRNLPEFFLGIDGSGGQTIYQMLTDHPLHWYALTYAAKVLRAHRLRVIIEIANEMLRDSYKNRDEPDAVLSRASAAIKNEESKSDPETVTAAKLFPELIEMLSQRAMGNLSGVSTPFPTLNQKTGGLQTQELVVIAARTSTGKTSIALNIAAHAAIDNKQSTLIVSLEMSNLLLTERILAFRANIDIMTLRHGRFTQTQMDRMELVRLELENSPLSMVCKPGRTLTKILAHIRRAKAKEDTKLIVIDYIQQINTGTRGSLYESTTACVKALKDLANELETPVIALSQLRREDPKKKGRKPRMQDLRDSGAIEESADLILLLHRPDYYDPNDQPGIAEMELAKNRNGPPCDLRLTFKKEIMFFEEETPVPTNPEIDWSKDRGSAY